MRKREWTDKELKQLEMLAGCGWSLKKLATFFGVSESSLKTRRINLHIKKGKLAFQGNLLARQYQVAMGQPGQSAEYLRKQQTADGKQYGDLVLDPRGNPILVRDEQRPQPPNVIMLKWLGTNYCDQSDRIPKGDSPPEPLEWVDPHED